MRKTASLFLAILIAVNSFGLLIFYWGEMQWCGEEAEISFSSGQVAPEASIAISPDDEGFHLINSHEILLKGKLFDIVKKEIRDGKPVYFAVSDNKEDGLVQNIAQLTNTNSTGNSLPVKGAVPEILKYTDGKAVVPINPDLSLLLFSRINTGNELFFYLSFSGDIFSPPPNIRLS